MIIQLLEGSDFSPIRATQVFLTFASHVIGDEVEQRVGNSKEIQSNIILAALERWSYAIRTWYSPWRRQKDMGGLLVALRHHNKLFLGQLGGHGCLTLTAIAYKQAGMARQRRCKEFPKATGSQLEYPGMPGWPLVRQRDRADREGGSWHHTHVLFNPTDKKLGYPRLCLPPLPVSLLLCISMFVFLSISHLRAGAAKAEPRCAPCTATSCLQLFCKQINS